MRTTTVIMLLLGAVASTAGAADPLLRAEKPPMPAKSNDHVLAQPTRDGREGGETIADAVPIPSLPFYDSGATCDNIDDYDEACPYLGSISPDVVYSYYLNYEMGIEVDLCGSSYDTKVYVYDEGLNLIECNDDYYFDPECGVYVSYLQLIFPEPDQNIYIVVDGYGGDCGEYQLEVSEFFIDCFVECPPGGVPEDEPPLENDYQDAWNGGCNSPEFGNPFQPLWGDPQEHLGFCGVAGWYTVGFSNYRDTDWFTAVVGQNGVIEAILEADWPCYLFELGPQDCETVAVVQQAATDYCQPANMEVAGAPGDLVWLWVGPIEFTPPDGMPTPFEFEYVLWLDGIASDVVATEMSTWSGVKRLYGVR